LFLTTVYQASSKCLEATDGLEALDRLAQHEVEVIISDILMPRMDGYRLCYETRKDQRFNSIPFIIYSSSYTSAEDEKTALNSGANRFIRKPSSMQTIIKAIHEETTEISHHTQKVISPESEAVIMQEYSERLVKKLEERTIELEQAKDVLAESEERFRATFEQAAVGIAQVGLDGRWLRVNQKLCDILGYTSQEMRAQTFQEITYAEDLSTDLEHRQRLISGAISTYSREKRYVRKDNSLIWINLTVSSVHDASGQPIYFISILEDITARKQAEEAMRLSEERYRDLFENANDIMYTLDLEGDFTSVNKKGGQLTGYEQRDFFSLKILDIIAPDYRGLAQNRISEILTDASATTVYEIEIVCKDGTRLPVEISSRAINEAGRSVGVQSIARDISERKRLEDQLRQSQKMESIGRLAGGIAHDFNNLLTAIIGYSQLVRYRLASEDPLRTDIEEIEKAGKRAAELTHQLLAFSRKQILQPKILDLNNVISNIEKMLRRLIGEDIEFRTELAADLGQVKVDPGQIDQIIMNLAVNARDAMPQTGKLTVETENVELDESYAQNHLSVNPGRYVMLAVSDTGIGMDKETQARIFEPFFTTKESGKGTGLGLATVYGIVKQSGGHIWVYSEKGQGTTFKIYLPRIEESTEAEEKPASSRETFTGTETILLVEDDEMVRQLTHQILELSGYIVLEASNPAEALRLHEAYKDPIHLMITDIVMPGMSGRELAQQLAQKGHQVKVLFISGYTDNAIVHHGILDEGTHFLQKPFTPDSLTRKIREILSEE
jgi:two-component system cell cycle sensor histidine kinase/response regulator CckA